MTRTSGAALSVAVIILSTGCISTGGPRHPAGAAAHVHGGAKPRQIDEAIPRNSTALFHDDDALFSYVKRYGLPQTIARLSELEEGGHGDCHQPAHKSGRYAYELYGVDTFGDARLECHVGGLHGAIEAYFRDHGTADLPQEARQICGTGRDPFFASQCFHGIGHGLMAATDYELPAALKGCDRLEQGGDSCYTGVFMENIVGGLAGHHDGAAPSKFVNGDPQYPCSIVETKYKSSCYLLQTSRMIQLFGPQFPKIAAACNDAPADQRGFCFQSMGRDVGGLHRNDAAGAIRACDSAPAGVGRSACIAGAVQDLFWDASGEKIVLQFCRSVTDAEGKRSCYDTIIGRASSILPADGRTEFCRLTEEPYRSQCTTALRQ